MGNPNTGEIYELTEGTIPEQGHARLTDLEAERLQRLEIESRKRELRRLVEQQEAQCEPAGIELPRYLCHKEVWALKIGALERVNDKGDYRLTPVDAGCVPFLVDHHYVSKHNPQPGGYFVVYQGGYKSFSPADVFESGYTRIP
jgi:hypothetical protein